MPTVDGTRENLGARAIGDSITSRLEIVRIAVNHARHTALAMVRDKATGHTQRQAEYVVTQLEKALNAL